MKYVKGYDEVNEEISRKSLATGILAGTLAVGGITGAGIHMRDRAGAPTEEYSIVKKDIPNNFNVNEIILTVGHDFWVTNDNGENFGKIEQRTISIGKKFEYFNSTGDLSAVAQARVIDWKTKIDIKDSRGDKIGTVVVEILEGFKSKLTKARNTYYIYDANDNLVAKSEAGLIFKNDVEIFDVNDKLIGKFHKNILQFGARWNCEIISNDIDKRLLIFIPAYITSKTVSGGKK